MTQASLRSLDCGQRCALAALFLAVGGTLSTASAQATFSESFDDVGALDGDGPRNLIDQGWTFRNQSQAAGTTVWLQGRSVNFPGYRPQAGSGYLYSTASWDDGNRQVSTWAILPAIPNQVGGDVLALYLTGGMTSTGELEVRYSPGGGTDTGSGIDDVGDFTQLLATDNAFAEFGNWLLLSAPVPGGGRLALRWHEPAIPSLQSPNVAIDTLTVGAPPCNAPPIPAPGETVTWAQADGPFVVCGDLTIPAGGTVIVEAGVEVDFDPGFQLTVLGTLRLMGGSASGIAFAHPAVFPPMILVDGGTLEATFASLGGQVRLENAATANLSDCTFSGNGLLWAQELPTMAPFVRLTRCTFSSSQLSLSDAVSVLEDNTFEDSAVLILRGYADLTAPNAFTGRPLEIDRERGQYIQPMFVDAVEASGVGTGAGLILRGGAYAVGPNVILQGNLYALDLEGGLLPGSTLPLAGNANNAINVGNGGFAGIGRWPDLGLPYRITQPTSSLPGGHLTIDPGVIVEASDPGAEMRFVSTRRAVLDGLPTAPITFRGLAGLPWGGLLFATNSTTGPRMEYCVVRDADFGAISSDNALYVDNCFFTNDDVGANTNTFGSAYFRKTRFESNLTGASSTQLGALVLSSPTNPNVFENNGAAIGADLGASIDARFCWWGDPSGPQAPGNPGGAGDSIVGPGASGVVYRPFLTERPVFADTPPVVRMIEPGFAGPATTPAYLLDPGTKYILRWDVQSNDPVVAQRIEFSPDGHFPSGFAVLVDGLPGDARSYELTVPEPGFAVTNQPQFLRIVSVDAAGQEAWDETPVIVPSGRLSGTLTITTDLGGQTFFANEVVPDLYWTGTVSDLPTVTPFIVLESEDAIISGIDLGGRGVFFDRFPYVSTDRARLALQARNNSNDVLWFFAEGYFSIRHDPRLGLVPPSVQVDSPAAGESFPGGALVRITWTAAAPEGVRSFDIQASYDAGRTWHPIARDLPAGARSYGWQLPVRAAIRDARVRVVVRDIRFQDSASDSGAFTIHGRTKLGPPIQDSVVW